MLMKKLSIVIPTLNRVEYLKLTIKSLLPQVIRNINDVELVISINATQDDTLDYVRHLTEEYNFLKYNSFETRVEISESFSRSIDLCSAKYVLIYGDDDFPNPYLVDIILDNLDSAKAIGLLHFNRLVGNDINPNKINNLRVENKKYIDSVLESNIEIFIKNYNISPGFISSMVFKKEAWELGKAWNHSGHYGYEFLGRIYYGIQLSNFNNCVYLSTPLVLQRMVFKREWNDKWPLYWLIGVPNLLKALDENNISNGAYRIWYNELSNPWLPFIYTLFWASSFKDIYVKRIGDIQNHQAGLLRKFLVFLIIRFSPKFVFSTIRKFIYRKKK